MAIFSKILQSFYQKKKLSKKLENFPIFLFIENFIKLQLISEWNLLQTRNWSVKYEFFSKNSYSD